MRHGFCWGVCRSIGQQGARCLSEIPWNGQHGRMTISGSIFKSEIIVESCKQDLWLTWYGPESRFVHRPQYHNHPKIFQIKAWVQDVWHQQKTRQMVKNIGCLYYIARKRKVQERDRKRMSVEKKDVKIAGTELQITPRWPDTSTRDSLVWHEGFTQATTDNPRVTVLGLQ